MNDLPAARAVSLAFDAFSKVQHTVAAAAGTNEATTRLRAIDTLLFHVLGWDKSAVDSEHYCRAVGFADYVLSSGGSKAMVIEAKRDEVAFVLKNRSYSDDPIGFGLLASECPEAAAALRQAAGYANTLGARFVAITNGHQWLLALTHVDGEELDARSVLVWESLDALKERFTGFYASFSPVHVGLNTASDRLFEPRRKPAPAKLSTLIPNYPVPANRNVIVNELSAIIGIVWTGVAHAEPTSSFLEECYVHPGESTDTLRLAAELLAEHRQQDVDEQQAVLPSTKAAQLLRDPPRRKPIIVLGRVGHGKTTFLRYLRLVEAATVLKGYCQMEVDFLDRPDSHEQVAAFVYDSIEEQLRARFGIDITENNTVRGILDSELARFRKSPRGVAFAQESEDYRRAEIEFIESITRDRPRFLKHVMHHLQAGQGKSIALFMDNLDRRDDAIQEEAFLRASAIAREWNCLVFVCLRPSTFHRSRREGVLDAIAPKTLSVSAPDPAILLKKRFEFAIRVARGDDVGVDMQTGKSAGSVAFDLPTVGEFLQCCRESFWRNRDLIALLEAASNGNTRDLLRLVQEVLTCNHLNTRKILNYTSTGYRIPHHEVVRALLYRDDMHYSPGRSCFLNLFDVEHSDRREHFGRLLVLSFLQRAGGGSMSSGFVALPDIIRYMSPHGFSAGYTRRVVENLYARLCVEGRVSGAGWEEATELRATSHGRYLFNHLVRTFNYVDAVVIDTPIIDEKVRDTVRDVTAIDERVHRAELFVAYLADCAKSLPDRDAQGTWHDIEMALKSDIAQVRQNLQRRGL